MRHVYIILLRLNAIGIISLCIMLFFRPCSFAQAIFKGVVLNKADSTPVPFAAIHLVETNEDILTGENGAFDFEVPLKLQRITINITAIGCKATVAYQRPFSKLQKVYVDVTAGSLNEVAIRGLTAEEVVKKAVTSIPNNYADSSYVAYAMYRQYQKVNGHFTNLVEMQPVTMFRLAKTKKDIAATEAFAIKQFRRTAYDPNPSNVYENNPADLLLENPVYHLVLGSLAPGKLTSYAFSFDTTNKTADYVIKYNCHRFSSEAHGWYDRDYWARFFHNESYEEGKLVIDRESFAIKQFDRTATRYPDYTYPRFPMPMNIVGGVHKYFIEFVNADLHATYAQANGKWYLTKICHEYTDEFSDIEMDRKDYVITDASEWAADSVSRYVSEDVYKKFFYRPVEGKYHYDKDFWDHNNFPFYFFDKDAVYHDLLREGPVEKQFYDQSTNDMTVR